MFQKFAQNTVSQLEGSPIPFKVILCLTTTPPPQKEPCNPECGGDCSAPSDPAPQPPDNCVPCFDLTQQSMMMSQQQQNQCTCPPPMPSPEEQYGCPPCDEAAMLPPQEQYGCPPCDEASMPPPEEQYGCPPCDEAAMPPPQEQYGCPPCDEANMPPPEQYGCPPCDEANMPPPEQYGCPPCDEAAMPPPEQFGCPPCDEPEPEPCKPTCGGECNAPPPPQPPQEDDCCPPCYESIQQQMMPPSPPPNVGGCDPCDPNCPQEFSTDMFNSLDLKFVSGDFNVHFDGKDCKTSVLCDIFLSCGMYSTTNFPTRGAVVPEAVESAFTMKSKLIDKVQQFPKITWFSGKLHEMREKLHLLASINNSHPNLVPKEVIKSYKKTYRREISLVRKKANDNTLIDPETLK
nr:unnamed protein product [Callosobruchus analis]